MCDLLLRCVGLAKLCARACTEPIPAKRSGLWFATTLLLLGRVLDAFPDTVKPPAKGKVQTLNHVHAVLLRMGYRALARLGSHRSARRSADRVGAAAKINLSVGLFRLGTVSSPATKATCFHRQNPGRCDGLIGAKHLGKQTETSRNAGYSKPIGGRFAISRILTTPHFPVVCERLTLRFSYGPTVSFRGGMGRLRPTSVE